MGLIVSTTKGITVGVVLSLLGSDVMNGRQAVTVAACVYKKSNNISQGILLTRVHV